MLHVGVAPGAKSDHQVGILRHHIEQRDGDLQRQVDLGIGFGELGQARDQHRPGKGGCNRQAQLALARRSGGAGKFLQCGEPLAHMGEVLAALGGQGKISPAKKPGSDDLLELLDPVADCAGCHKQFVAGLRHAAQAGKASRLTGTESVEFASLASAILPFRSEAPAG